MKKLFSLLAVAAFALCAVAETVTFTNTNDAWSSTQGQQSVTKDGITIGTTSGVGNGDQYRIYKNQTFVVSSVAGNITSVEITCTASGTSQYGPGCFTDPTPGTYTCDAKVGTWTGNAESLALTASTNQVRATQIVVTYTADASATKAPNFSVNSGTYTAAQTVTITCATAGATIYYTLDGSEPTNASTVYSAPITISTNTTLKAIAYAGAKASPVTSATYTIINVEGEGTQANPYTIADLKLLNNNGATGVWVVGTVYGVYASNKPSASVGTTNSNLALVSGNDTIPVQLPSGDVRTAINLVDHPELIGTTIKVKGDLLAYFSTTGVKNTSDYELSSISTSIEAVVEEKAEKLMINGQIYIRKNGVLYNALGAVVE